MLNIPLRDKQVLGRLIGSDLRKHFGERSTFGLNQVLSAARRQNVCSSVDLWAVALYAQQSEFEMLCNERGEVHDYVSMHHSMEAALEHEGLSLPDIQRRRLRSVSDFSPDDYAWLLPKRWEGAQSGPIEGSADIDGAFGD